MESSEPRLTYATFPARLARYLIAVSVLGPIIAVGVAAAGARDLTRDDAAWMLFFLPLLALAERYPVHLTHKANINVATAAYIALILLLPSPFPGVVALAASIAGQLWRRSDQIEALFNIGQTGIYVTIGALIWAAAGSVPIGPSFGTLGPISALVAASLALHLANTVLVSLAGAFQLGSNPLRVWWRNLDIDLMPHLTLTILGVVSALLLVEWPLLLPFLILPAALVHHSVDEMTKLRVDTHEALVSLVEVIELQDPYTAGHSHRVAALARILAIRLGRTAEEADLIEQAGRVHDIGKVAVTAEILGKEHNLTEVEWAQMRLHPVHGENVISQFGVFRQVAKLVRHHHEAWDGSGYPDRIAGDAIPYGSRILSVVDTFDALTTDRPYRPGMSVDEATEILEAGAGTQWDASIVTVMCDYLRATGGETPRHLAALPATRPTRDLLDEVAVSA